MPWSVTGLWQHPSWFWDECWGSSLQRKLPYYRVRPLAQLDECCLNLEWLIFKLEGSTVLSPGTLRSTSWSQMQSRKKRVDLHSDKRHKVPLSARCTQYQNCSACSHHTHTISSWSPASAARFGKTNPPQTTVLVVVVKQPGVRNYWQTYCFIYPSIQAISHSSSKWSPGSHLEILGLNCLTESSSSWFQTGVFPCLTWRCHGMNLGLLPCKICDLSLSYSSSPHLFWGMCFSFCSQCRSYSKWTTAVFIA